VSVVFGVCYIRKVYFRSQFVFFFGGGGMGEADLWGRFVMTCGRVRMLGVCRCFVCVGLSL